MDNQLTADRLKEMATRIAEYIVRDESLAVLVSLELAASAKCPEGELCCKKGYICGPDMFYCYPIFTCTRSFLGLTTEIRP